MAALFPLRPDLFENHLFPLTGFHCFLGKFANVSMSMKSMRLKNDFCRRQNGSIYRGKKKVAGKLAGKVKNVKKNL